MAKSDDYLSRIERLNGRPLQNRPEPGSDVEGVRRKLKKASQAKAPTPASPKAPAPPPIIHRQVPEAAPRPRRATRGTPVSLAEALAGVETPSPCGGRAYLVESRPETDYEEAAGIGSRLRWHLGAETPLRRRLTSFARREEVPADQLLFVDIETTGLANTPLFLIGTLEVGEEGLLVRQFFARDYSEESGVTSLFLQQAAGKQLLVTFNGITFDLRFIRERAAVHGVRYDLAPPHLDLLPLSRQVWGRRLPNCKLQTLETYICGRQRDDDIPGHLIPEAYHEYVRTGDAAEMVEVIKHNALDLVTMADLLLRLPG